MCEICSFQRETAPIGLCQNKKAAMYKQICPALELGADVRDCPNSKVPSCNDNRCTNCEGGK